MANTSTNAINNGGNNSLQYLDSKVVAKSARMNQVINLARKVAETDCTVLVLGESGVGKEVIAKLIHNKSLFYQGPFIKVNCGAIPETLLESELFGYSSGAFTGARKEGKTGKFELAHNGTLFLDEIGDLPFSLQVKLLHVLEEKEVVRVGGSKPQKINVRIVTATNKDLLHQVKTGKFRKDLYYRLNIIPIQIPPLRERRDDIMPLIIHFKKICESKYGTRRNCSAEVINLFCSHDWPGNVRELKNMLERIYIISETDKIITPEVLVKDYLNITSGYNNNEAVIINKLGTLQEIKEEAEKQLIKLALKSTGTLYKTAQLLQVDKATISRKAKKYNLIPRKN